MTQTSNKPDSKYKRFRLAISGALAAMNEKSKMHRIEVNKETWFAHVASFKSHMESDWLKYELEAAMIDGEYPEAIRLHAADCLVRATYIKVDIAELMGEEASDA